MNNSTDHAGLIDSLGGAAKLSEGFDACESDLRAQPVSIRAWAARNRIPPEYWPGVIKFAASLSVEVTADWLMLTTPARRNAVSATDETNPSPEPSAEAA